MNPLTYSIKICSEHVSNEVEFEGIAHVHHRANVLGGYNNNNKTVVVVG